MLPKQKVEQKKEEIVQDIQPIHSSQNNQMKVSA
jgi:hypothetical protein